MTDRSDPTDVVGMTSTIGAEHASARPDGIRTFQIEVTDGPAKGAVWTSEGERCSVGSHGLNDLVIEDTTVSRFHCELQLLPDGVIVRDQDSRNGTIVDGVRVKAAYLRGGSMLRLGRTVLRFQFGTERRALLVSQLDRFGALVGSSVAMRSAFALLERASAADVTVLLEGETGTGKGAAAEAIHDASSRKSGPFVVIDCGAIPANLLESELFGHERGAFTGADATRTGAFEEASGGTIFLDEIGELPVELQPKLLRVLEDHTIRRVGSNDVRRVDVRVIAATNRDLRAEVNVGRFRSDLYYRLAVVKIRMPALRERPEDIPAMIETMLDTLHASDEQRASIRSPDFTANLRGASWPGNVRELRNYVERWLVFRDVVPEFASGPAPGEGRADPPVDPSQPYADARKGAIERFEKSYVTALLAHHDGVVSRAAAAAKMDRVYLYRLLRRHGLRGGS